MVKVTINYLNGEKREYEDIDKDSISIENGFLTMNDAYYSDECYYVNLTNSIDIKVER